MALTGTHHIRPTHQVLKAIRKLWPAVQDYMEVRHQYLKLRFWGARHEADAATGILDLSYESIKALPGLGVYELRYDEAIAGIGNIRAIFLEPEDSWVSLKPQLLPPLYITDVIAKKRDQWTISDLNRFKEQRRQVRLGFYKS